MPKKHSSWVQKMVEVGNFYFWKIIENSGDHEQGDGNHREGRGAVGNDVGLAQERLLCRSDSGEVKLRLLFDFFLSIVPTLLWKKKVGATRGWGC